MSSPHPVLSSLPLLPGGAELVQQESPAEADATQSAIEVVGQGTRESLRLLDLPAPWLVVLVILPLFALVAWGGYVRESLPAVGRVVLGAMRFGALLLLFLVLARPVRVERREVLLGVDVLRARRRGTNTISRRTAKAASQGPYSARSSCEPGSSPTSPVAEPCRSRTETMGARGCWGPGWRRRTRSRGS